MINQCKSFLLERTREWDLPSAGEWNFLFNNNYHPHYSSLNLLWFHNGGEFPRVVTKVFPEPQIPHREFDNLQHAYRCAPNFVPKPLYVGAHGAFWVLWMQGVPGFRFRVHDGCSPATLHSLVEMITSIHGAVRKDKGATDADRYRRSVLEPLRTVAEFGPSASVREGCAHVAARASEDWLHSLPVIPQHGDLFVSNVLSYRGKWSVVDWESFGIIDLPFYDLFTLLLSLLRNRGEMPEQWDPFLVNQMPSLIESYAQKLQLSAAAGALLLPLTLANWFHLQWSDGRERFTELMYKAIGHYFERLDLWEKVFVPSASRRNA